jgi:pimeloyl-ACP methyl ester carboxylesterase
MEGVAKTAFYMALMLIPSIIPLKYQSAWSMISPALSWFYASSLLASYSPRVFTAIAVPHGAASVAALFSIGFRSSLCTRLLYLPLLGSMASWMGAGAVAYSASGCYPVLLLHASSFVLGAIRLLIFPAPVVKDFINVELIRSQAHLSSVHLLTARVPCGEIALSGILIYPKDVDPKAQKQFVLYLGGNGEMHEASLPNLVYVAKKLGTSVFMINHRGVGDSEGVTTGADTLVADARAAVDYLIKTYETTPGRVVALGHSIGGGVAAQLAGKYYREMPVVLDRTFSTLVDAAISLSPLQGHPNLVRFVVSRFFGDLDTVRAWSLIPHQRKLITYHRLDPIIRFSDSSLGRLQQFQPGGEFEPQAIELTNSIGPVADPHNCALQDLSGGEAVFRRIAEFLDLRRLESK